MIVLYEKISEKEYNNIVYGKVIYEYKNKRQ